MSVYYNEIDRNAAAWLRELIKHGHIAHGVVDERSISDVKPNELVGFTQCHFFAGIGGWSLALRKSGWSDDRPVWTGSCPCQPFSAAGARGGMSDERHLWPHWHHLINQCRPATVFGEQVASKDGLNWLDLVSADMEATGYAFAAADLCAAGVGAPHIRQRLWFVGQRLDDTAGARHCGALKGAEGQAWDKARLCMSGEGGGSGGMADAGSQHLRGGSGKGNGTSSAAERETWQWQRGGHDDCTGGANGRLADAADAGFQIGRGGSGVEPGSVEQSERLRADSGLADANGGNTSAEREQRGGQQRQQQEDSGAGCMADASADRPQGRIRGGQDQEREAVNRQAGCDSAADRPSTLDSQWRDADWLFCRDGKWRPVEPGTFPLAHGLSARVGRLRGYGNAIVPQAAQTIIESVM
jgi:DNA (cytosine-5)-methyltransferase 1